jgi:tetratricopeptide (TPR) repeat protein
MARSAQRNKRQPSQRSRTRPEGAKPKRASTPVPRSYEDEMFFPRLRRQAKWMFLALALVFGLGYVIFNVGGTIPGTGIGDILQNAAQADGRPDVGDAEDRVRDNPASASAKLELADAYIQNDRTDDAIPVLEQYLEQRPNDEDVVSQLAGLYMGQASQHAEEAQLAQAQVQAAAPGSLFAPATGMMNQLRAQGEVEKALSAQANERLSQASSEATISFQQARDTYRRLGELKPRDASVQFSLAQAATQASDFETAIAAYKRFIKLAPDDANVPAIRQQISLLEAQKSLQPELQPSPQGDG